MPSRTTPLRTRLSLRLLLQVVVLGLLLYLVFAGLGGLHASMQAIRSADIKFIFVAELAVIGSYICAVLTYMLLAPKRLRFIPTLWIEVSGCLANRLLPGGLGGLGIHALYLKKQGHSLATASATVATNNTLGLVGNLLLLVLAGFLAGVPLPNLPTKDGPHVALVASIVLAVLTTLILAIKKPAIVAATQQVAAYLRLLLKRPARTLGALAVSMGLTAMHASGLYFVLFALHNPVGWPVALVAVSAGSLGGALVPTPGGLGGAEAGIAAVLTGLSVSAPEAVAAALTYRGLTYWLPLLPGYLALRVAEKRYL